jgi:hypothetical protein
LCPGDDSFNAEAFPNLKVSRGFSTPAYSFNAEAFSNLKVSIGFSPRNHSYNAEAFPNLMVSTGFCQSRLNSLHRPRQRTGKTMLEK